MRISEALNTLTRAVTSTGHSRILLEAEDEDGVPSCCFLVVGEEAKLIAAQLKARMEPGDNMHRSVVLVTPEADVEVDRAARDDEAD